MRVIVTCDLGAKRIERFEEHGRNGVCCKKLLNSSGGNLEGTPGGLLANKAV